jgi:hypothetical protein
MCLVLSSFVVFACSDDGADSTDNTPLPSLDDGHSNGDGHGEDEVHVFLTEYAIEGEDGAPVSSPPAGEVTFEAHNEGEIEHELVVIKTDIAAAELPTDGTVVDENATGVDFVGEIEPFEAGGAELMTLDLEAGAYVLICNVAGHYQQGMYAAMTVE